MTNIEHEIQFLDADGDPIELDYSDYSEPDFEKSFWYDYGMMVQILGQATLDCLEADPENVHWCWAGEV